MRRVSIAAGIGFVAFCAAAGLLWGAGNDTRGTTTAPATPPTTQTGESAADLIARLGDPDPAARDEAGKMLWAMGRAAEPALHDAAAAGNPEIARRARAILRDFTYGLYPDAPREVFALLEQYRKGEPQEKQAAIQGLALHGVPGLRVLLKLREDERDANWKLFISQALAPREHEVSVLMLANGQADEVERMLERSAADSPVAAQDYAALLYFRGGLKEALAKRRAEPITPENAALHVALARAAGDGPAAREAAQKSGDGDLLNAVLIEQGDWHALAARVAAEPHGLQPAEQLAYLCAYARLAGDAKASDAAAIRLIERARVAPEDCQSCAEDLFLNDHTEAALALLLRQHNYVLASEFLGSRLQFKEALDLPKLAERDTPAEAIQVKARAVGTLLFVGDAAGASKLIDEVIAENALRHDFNTWVYLVEAAREGGLTGRVDDLAARALATATQQDPVGWLFEKMRLGDGPAAAHWWQFLQHEAKDKPAAEKLHRLRQIVNGSLPLPAWDALSESATRYGVDLPIAERSAWQQTVADTMTAGGRADLAAQWIVRIEDAGNVAALVHAGDYRASAKDWAAAARDYERAWEHDRTRADALFLDGWALAQAGQAPAGAAKMDQARELPLGNETGRFELAEAMSRHHLKDEAVKQFELILTLTAPRSWERNEALRRTAEDMADAGDDLAAADRWDKAFLQNLSNNTSFIEPWANVVVPALIHKTRALGRIKAGQVDAGLNEATTTMRQTPADADALIEIVNALDAAGHRPEADAFYAKHTEIYRKVIADYPNSGPLHNQLAWAEVMCHRELDDALKNGGRAVELEPGSTASRDTLAEVYFARGDATAAAAEMQRCVELEPKVDRHRKQLARFQAAASTQPTTRP